MILKLIPDNNIDRKTLKIDYHQSVLKIEYRPVARRVQGVRGA